jgi:DNA-binding beta-propeller fold protein YncE
MKRVHIIGSNCAVLGFAGLLCISAVDYRVPGVNYPAQLREDLTILPGGRVLRPYGKQILTGTGVACVDVSPNGKTIVAANIGISLGIGLNRASITVIVPDRHGLAWGLSDFAPDPLDWKNRAWQGVSTGLAVNGEGTALLSEGNSGRVVELNLSAGTRKRAIDLNTPDYPGSFTGPMAFDPASGLLFVLDQANGRTAIVDTKRGLPLASVKTGSMPIALALSSGDKRLYVANAESLSITDISSPTAPSVIRSMALASEPAGIAVRGNEVYLSIPAEDEIAIVNAATASLMAVIPLRIPGLEAFRGIAPVGLAFEPKSGRLMVAESGINAVGVIDPESRKLVGHIPTGWFPCAIQTHDGQIYVANMRGLGTGPSTPAHRFRFYGHNRRTDPLPMELLPSALRRGTVGIFTLPDEKELAHQTDVVMENNGFKRSPVTASRKPPIRYVVVIAKGNRSFDEVFGDVERAGDRTVLSESTFARYGQDGYVSGNKKMFSLRVNVTPNEHQLAAHWTFADNYYAPSDYMLSGLQWLHGIFPDFSREAGFLLDEAGNKSPLKFPSNRDLSAHLAAHGIDSLDFGENSGVSDPERASKFLATLRKEYLETGKPLPRLLFVTLPGDCGAEAKPANGYPYDASFIAEDDYELGRIVDFLSHTPWWREMAIFVTGTGAEGGADHIDSHRTFLLGVGPWFRNNYVSHTNASFPSLLKTIFQLLDVPPLSLYDATASDLTDMFGNVPDFAPYDVRPEDGRLFDPAKVR